MNSDEWNQRALDTRWLNEKSSSNVLGNISIISSIVKKHKFGYYALSSEQQLFHEPEMEV